MGITAPVLPCGRLCGPQPGLRSISYCGPSVPRGMGGCLAIWRRSLAAPHCKATCARNSMRSARCPGHWPGRNRCAADIGRRGTNGSNGSGKAGRQGRLAATSSCSTCIPQVSSCGPCWPSQEELHSRLKPRRRPLRGPAGNEAPPDSGSRNDAHGFHTERG